MWTSCMDGHHMCSKHYHQHFSCNRSVSRNFLVKLFWKFWGLEVSNFTENCWLLLFQQSCWMLFDGSYGFTWASMQTFIAVQPARHNCSWTWQSFKSSHTVRLGQSSQWIASKHLVKQLLVFLQPFMIAILFHFAITPWCWGNLRPFVVCLVSVCKKLEVLCKRHFQFDECGCYWNPNYVTT